MTHQTEQTHPVLIIDLAKRYGGAEVRVLDTAKSLQGQQLPYAVATLNGSPLHQRLEAANLVSLPVPFSRGDPRLIPFLLRAIRQEGYRVVDAHNVQSQLWGHLAALPTGVTKVSTIHSAYKLEHNKSLKGRLYEQVLRLNARLGIKFIAVSGAVYTYLQEASIPAESISLIPNSIHIPEAAPSETEHPLLASLGWGKESYVVLIVARLEPVKAHTFLIEAINQLTQKQPRLRCLIVGEGRTQAELESQIEQSNLGEVVHMAGFRNDIPALLQACDLFCLPSHSEGLPYALLEACTHRLPSLISKVGGMAEHFSHQQTAFLVPPANSDALAEGLCWFLDNPTQAAAMGQAAYDYVEQQFNPDKMIAQVLAVYHQE